MSPNLDRRQLLAAAGVSALAVPTSDASAQPAAPGAPPGATSMAAPAAYPASPVTTGAERAAADGWPPHRITVYDAYGATVDTMASMFRSAGGLMMATRTRPVSRPRRSPRPTA